MNIDKILIKSLGVIIMILAVVSLIGPFVVTVI